MTRVGLLTDLINMHMATILPNSNQRTNKNKNKIMLGSESTYFSQSFENVRILK
jgi:hypothetical protein